MAPQLHLATTVNAVGWQQTVVAFLAEKEGHDGSKQRVEGYLRVLWPFDGGFRTPAEVTPAHVLAWAHGRGLSGHGPSSATVVARIAGLSSYYRFLIQMQVLGRQPMRCPRGADGLPRSIMGGPFGNPVFFEDGRGEPNGASWRPFWRPLSARAGPVGSEC